MKALEEEISCYDLCTKYGKLHEDIYKWFLISFDYFGRTSTKDPIKDTDWLHTQISQDIFNKLQAGGYLYRENSRQLYCKDLNMFVSDRFITGTCYVCGFDKANGDQCDKCCTLIDTNQLIKPVCKIKGKEYECGFQETSHYYLNLVKLKPELESWFNDKHVDWSKNVPGVTKSWLENLKNRCITRDISWGTPLPNEEKKNLYNWFDAPIGYISCVANHFKEKYGEPEKYKEWFCNNNDNITTIHAFSKDNIVFHTTMFPATLIGAGMTHNIVVSGSKYKIASCEYLNYMTDTGPEKFSKSRKIGIFGDDAIRISNNNGISPDYWRYYLIKIRPETSDSVFDIKEFVNVCNTDLCCKYGNLVNRLKKLYEILVNTLNSQFTFDVSKSTMNEILKIEAKYHTCFETLQLRQALSCCMKMVDFANQYISEKTPWKLKLTEEDELLSYQEIVGCVAWMIIVINESFRPFIPGKSEMISQTYRIDKDKISLNFTSMTTIPFAKLSLDMFK